jgi:hypothetical protein
MGTHETEHGVESSSYETEESVEAAHIPTVARARKQWRREGSVAERAEGDFIRDDSPEAVQD